MFCGPVLFGLKPGMSLRCATTDVWILPCPGLSSKPSGSPAMKHGDFLLPWHGLSQDSVPRLLLSLPYVKVLHLLIYLIFFLIWEKTLCSPCWDETCQHLASAYWIRGLHVCISKSNFQLLNRTEIGLYLSHCFLNIRFICKIDSSMELENPIL